MQPSKNNSHTTDDETSKTNKVIKLLKANERVKGCGLKLKKAKENVNGNKNIPIILQR